MLDSVTKLHRRGPFAALGAAITSALALLLAFPPSGWWPVAWFGLVPLYRALVPADGSRSRGGLIGFVFGLVLHGAGVYWMNRIGAGPWIGLALLQATHFAIWGMISGWVLPRLPRGARPWAFAAGWVAFEWARSCGPYAFPWFLLATAHTRDSALPWLQIVSITSQWGLSFLAAWGNAMLAEGWAARRSRWVAGASAGFVACGSVGLVLLQMVHLDGLSSDIRRIKVAVVQGAEDRGADRETVLQTYSDLTMEVPKDTDLVIWPETAVTGDKASRWAVDRLAITIGIPVLTGMIEGNADGTLRNSIRLFPETNGSQSYAKRQIVPFGEFFPLREFLDPIFEDYGVTYPNFASGTQPGVFRVRKGDTEFSVGTAICYESAFPYVARDTVRAGADILASLTSDQTFEGTVQLEQHLDQDKVRAVENGRWLVRVASTGITAIIGPDGRETQSGYAERPGPVRLPLGKPGVLYATVDPPVSNPKGAAAVRVGDTVAWMCGIGSLLSIAFACRGGRSGLGLKRAAKENP